MKLERDALCLWRAARAARLAIADRDLSRAGEPAGIIRRIGERSEVASLARLAETTHASVLAAAKQRFALPAEQVSA